MTRCLIGLGANLGDAEQTVQRAARALGELKQVQLLAVSPFATTDPVGGPPGQPSFVNAAALIETTQEPHELVGELQEVERQHGRLRPERWAARTLDLDLLLYGEEAIESEGLVTPHPRMSHRPFVLKPAVQVAGDWIHPHFERTLSDLWRVLRQGADMAAVWGGEEEAGREALAWIHAFSPTITHRRISEEEPQWESPPRLTVAICAPQRLPWAGPTVWLPQESPTKTRREDLVAALACVWPGVG